MRTTITATALLLALASAGAQAAPWGHGERGDYRPQPRYQQSGGGVSLDEAVARVRAETGGRILSASPVSANGHRYYRIKVLTPDQRVRVIRVDAGER